jgi:WD40 repeat protein
MPRCTGSRAIRTGSLSVAFSPDGKSVVSVSYDEMVRLWGAATGAAPHTLEGRSDLVIVVGYERLSINASN